MYMKTSVSGGLNILSIISKFKASHTNAVNPVICEGWYFTHM